MMRRFFKYLGYRVVFMACTLFIAALALDALEFEVTGECRDCLIMDWGNDNG